MPGVEWWYMDVMGDKQGPVTLQHLKDLYKKEKIFLGTQIWGTGQGEWKKLWEMPTIRKIVAGKRFVKLWSTTTSLNCIIILPTPLSKSKNEL
mmetsp:Transcript_19286/g.30656  ORF Transcript_19286/g.30656 Transcript_19286/m.30656 type:complete len:93 (+) Transcript_19286:104-382(+)